MGPGKCPKCENLVTRINLHGVQASVPFGTVWNSITYNCPSCNTVLGVSIDPIAIKADIVAEILKGKGGRT